MPSVSLVDIDVANVLSYTSLSWGVSSTRISLRTGSGMSGSVTVLNMSFVLHSIPTCTSR